MAFQKRDQSDFDGGIGSILEAIGSTAVSGVSIFIAFIVSLVAVAAVGIGFGLYFDSFISCVIASALVMGVTGLVADYRSKGDLSVLPFNKPCGFGMICGFLAALILVSVLS